VIVAVALCPATPLLVTGISGTEAVLPELLDACRRVAAELLSARPAVVAVVGAGGAADQGAADGQAVLAAFAPGRTARAEADGGAEPGVPSARRPLTASLGVGDWLLDDVGATAERLFVPVPADEPAAGCVGIGAALATRPQRTALLVMADGSARRGPKAPGHFDQRSVGFDAEVERAVRAGDLDALLAIDAGLADELMATGRPAWQVLAGALAGRKVASEILYCDDPLGVAYLVASLRVRPVGEE
jgi:hypothetical protein